MSEKNSNSFKFILNFRDLLITAVLALILIVPFVGFYKDSRGIVETLVFRWQNVLILLAGVLIFRVISINIREYLAKRNKVLKVKKVSAPSTKLFSLKNSFVVLLLILLIIIPFMPFASQKFIDNLTVLLIYIMLGWGLNVVIGLAGLLNLGYVAFYAVGAYSYALLAQYLGIGFWVSLPLAGLMAMLFGLLLGYPVLRLRGDYLAIVTLGFGEIIRIILLATPIFGQAQGIGNIPRPTLFGLSFVRNPKEGEIAFHQFFNIEFNLMHRIIFLYYLILILALLTNWFSLRIRKLPIGRAWEALRENEIACQSVGINLVNVKLTAFMLGALFAGFAGAFFATRQGFISPESFTFLESALMVAIVVLGGLGSQLGIVFAAAFLVLIPEYFREFESYRMLLFGAAMVAIMVWKPTGFVGEREPTVRLHPKGYKPIDDDNNTVNNPDNSPQAAVAK